MNRQVYKKSAKLYFYISKVPKYVLIYFLLAPFLLWLSIFCTSNSHAQEVQSLKKEATEAKDSLDSEKQQLNLAQIISSLDALEIKLKEEQAKLSQKKFEGDKEEIQTNLKELIEEKKKLVNDFTEISTGIDLRTFDGDSADKKLTIQERLEELLSPLLDELNDITNAPREINYLENEITTSKRKLQKIDKALDNINEIIKNLKNPEISSLLNDTKENWEAKKQDTSSKLSIAEQKLQTKLNEKKSLRESVGNIFALFFEERGRNIFVALLLTFLFWFSIRAANKKFENMKFSKRKKLITRISRVCYYTLSIFGTIFVFVMTLYFFGDWVLLTLTMLLLLGLAWASRLALPKFSAQISLLLNLGPVREGERIIYKNLPWSVKKLNFHSLLHNPELRPSTIKLPMSDLVGLRSRKADPTEPWFPTQLGDWILLPDKSMGEIVLQSPDIVQISQPSGAQKIFYSKDFLSLVPQVLSKGFLLSFDFGLDYNLQGDISSKIPKILKGKIKEALNKRGVQIDDSKITVEFKEAAASALIVAVMVTLKGSYAKEFYSLKRYLNKVCVECCNQNSWNIPFDQLMVHIDKEAK